MNTTPQTRSSKWIHWDETTLVFTTLLQGILRRAVQRDRKRLARLRRYLTNSLGHTNLSASADARVRDWTHQPQLSTCESLAPSLTADERTELLNLLYVSICAEMGPVAADRIFADAAKETDTLPEALKHPARNFF